MADSEQRNRFANLLEQVIDGKLTAADALKMAEAWHDVSWKERALNVAWHTLVHFNIDSDIREKNSEFDERMRKELRRHASILRAG